MIWEQCKACIFDMDGVLINSVDTHARCWDEVAERYGLIHTPECMQRGNGHTSLSYVQKILRWTQDPDKAQCFVDEKESVYHTLVEQEGVELVKGVHEFLHQLQERKLPLAVGTSAPRSNADTILERAGIRSFFECVVTAEDVVKGKPDPEVFLKASKGLGVEPQQCVVFEDAKAGVQAARAGGMYVIALTTTQPPEDLEDAHAIYPSFEVLI